MAEKLAELRKKGGGKAKETVLWTNSTPTSNFDAQSINLNVDWTTYDWIRVYFRVSTSVSTSNYVDFPVSLVESASTASNTIQATICARVGSTQYARSMRYQSNTTLYFPRANAINQQSESQAGIIPTQISGIKF